MCAMAPAPLTPRTGAAGARSRTRAIRPLASTSRPSSPGSNCPNAATQRTGRPGRAAAAPSTQYDGTHGEPHGRPRRRARSAAGRCRSDRSSPHRPPHPTRRPRAAPRAWRAAGPGWPDPPPDPGPRAAPHTRWAAAGAKRSRPSNVPVGRPSLPRPGSRSMAARTPPSAWPSGTSSPLSGPTNHDGPAWSTARSTATATARRSVPTPGSTTAMTTPAPRYGPDRTSMAAPAVTSKGGIWWDEVDHRYRRRQPVEDGVDHAHELVGGAVVGEEVDRRWVGRAQHGPVGRFRHRRGLGARPPVGSHRAGASATELAGAFGGGRHRLDEGRAHRLELEGAHGGRGGAPRRGDRGPEVGRLLVRSRPASGPRRAGCPPPAAG